MSLTNSNRISIPWSNVDAFTFGKSSLYGYDSLNHCLLLHSLTQLNNTNEISTDRLHLSSSPTWPIRRLILNQDESILALLADKIAYLVYLTQSNVHTPSKGSRLCPIIRVLPSVPSSSINCSLIDFVWLTSTHFAIVYSIPSASECHLYTVRSSKHDGLEPLQTFPVGYSSTNKFGTPNKKISLHQPSDIIKLDTINRKDKDTELILLFAMKTDGDIFILEIDPNELLSDNDISGEFQGPLRILPSLFDNYGADHGQSTFICLSNSNSSILVFTRDKCQLNQCIVLSPSANQYYLFTIDSISLPTSENGQILSTIIRDSISPNRYFISDSMANVYSVEISWIEQIQQGAKRLRSTCLQHLINGANAKNKIEQMNVIQIDNTNEQYLAVIVKAQQRELILLRLQSTDSDEKLEFVEHIRSLLVREQSIPYVTLSPSSTNISDSDLEKNLSQFSRILLEQYINKQHNVREELESKQRYLADFQQTQINENQPLIEKFQQIQKRFRFLKEQYQEECSRQKRLATHVDDLLSVMEQNTPVLSDAEGRMQQQLETYQVQIDYLKERIQLLRQFISSNQNQEQVQNFSLDNVQNYVLNYRNQIDQMKKRLETIENRK